MHMLIIFISFLHAFICVKKLKQIIYIYIKSVPISSKFQISFFTSYVIHLIYVHIPFTYYIYVLDYQ